MERRDVLNTMLGSRFGKRAPRVQYVGGPEMRQVSVDPVSWLGKPPSQKHLSTALSDIAKNQLMPPYWPEGQVDAWGGEGSLMSELNAAFGEEKRRAKFDAVWTKAIAELRQDPSIDVAALRVVLVIPMGGAPGHRYALGDDPSLCAAAQVSLAKTHGILFDVLPVFFSDFHGDLRRMAVVVGAAVLARVRSRDVGECRVDAVMFACKGTAPTCLGVAEYCRSSNPDPRRCVPLIGMGTDLQYVTNGATSWGQCTAEVRGSSAPMLIFHSPCDSAVGDGFENVERCLSEQRRGVDANVARVFKFETAEANAIGHKWYKATLDGLPGSSIPELSSKEQPMLSEISGFVRHCRS